MDIILIGDIINFMKLDKKYSIDEKSGCWNWTGSFTNEGYGQLGMGGKVYRAHRLVFESLAGRIPAGKILMHMCDNRGCVNPAHLVIGTQRENVADKVNKRRQSMGFKHYKCRLSPDDVNLIIDMWSRGYDTRTIASFTPITHSAIHYMINGRVWKSVREQIVSVRFVFPHELPDGLLWKRSPSGWKMFKRRKCNEGKKIYAKQDTETG